MKQPYRILCFGDSNTWGYNSKKTSRFPREARWTGKISSLLGQDYEIMEEGLNGRTSGFSDSIKPYTDGYAYMLPCLLSHVPLDYITVMLGTNDIKTRFHASPNDIASSIGDLLLLIQNTLFSVHPNIKILLIAPVPVRQSIISDPEYDISAVEKSQLLVPLLQETATLLQVEFLNASDYIYELDEDGCHLTVEGHSRLAKAVASKIYSDLH